MSVSEPSSDCGPELTPARARRCLFAGTVCTVYEADCSGLAGARRDRCLIFESDLAWRCVWAFPDNWRSLSDAELERLGW